MIPKNIFQSWYTKNLHPVIQEKINNMMYLNPDYNHKIYTDNEIDSFVNEHFPGIIANCYNKLNIIVAKVDFWRYLILYKYGGIYLDMDSIINISLNNLINENDEAIITAESNPGYFVQWALIFNKEHPILKKTIDIIVENITLNKYPNNIHKMTGPYTFSRAVNVVHKNNTGRQLRHFLIHKNFNMTFLCRNSSYKIYSINYNNYFTFKYNEINLLYDGKKHWREEEKQIQLLH
jgi:mannosyltransferase OCH1-like enzyme